MGEKLEAAQKLEATEKKVIIDEKQKKVDEGPITVVLKLDLHCDGCAKKVKKSVRYIEGVESVKADSKSNKLTITGKVNPMHIKERVEYKTKKKVEILSPKPKKDDVVDKDQADKQKAAGDKPAAAAAAAATEAKSNNNNDQKPKQPQSTSVVLKISLHCDGCIQKIKRIILKIDGVESVKPDGNKNLVTVTGTMNMKELVPYLKDKLKRNVDVVPPKKEDDKQGTAEKKDETKVEGDEKKKDEKKAEGNENKQIKEKEGESKKKNYVAKEAQENIKSVVEKKKKDEEEKVASSGESEKNKSGGEATSIGSGDGDGSKKNVNVTNKLEYYYRHDHPAYTYTMAPVVYNQSYHNNQDYGVPVNFPTHDDHGYGNDQGYNHGGYAMMMGYPPPPPSPMSIHNPPSENDVFSAENPNACSIM